MARTPLNTQGLNKVSGKNFEDLTKILEEDTAHLVSEESTSPQDGYFRQSTIWVTDLEEVQKRLGEPDRRATSKNRMLCYYAEYERGEEFDETQLTGGFRFNEGRLVERTLIYENPKLVTLQKGTKGEQHPS